jgi:hypothetical protein
MGGIQGALAQHAEATYRALPSEQHRTLARALFLRLIEAGQTEQDTTRRRASYNELTLPDAEQTRILHETADAFVNARLLVTDQTGDERTIEVSHEALIREWKRLGTWLHDAREDLRLQKSLAVDVAEWQRRGNPDDMLYRGTVLAEAQAWADRNTASRDETRFLHESQRTEEDRQRREARAARNLRYAVFGLVSVILVAAIGLSLIFAQNNADLLAEVDYIESQVNFAATREFGISPFDITQTPAVDFAATATAYAELRAWEPVTETFDGVEMVLVPAGCFYMGSNLVGNEQPIHEICFDEPFWIDKFEVTNEDYGSVGCEDESSEPDQPRNCVNWFEASDHCEARGARLPTEAEWEYAARGPDSLVYPWGNAFNMDFSVWAGNSRRQTAPVGSRSEGVSWAGALDLSGNLYEWTSSLFEDYPYGDDHESDSDTRSMRVPRGGSFSSVTLRSSNRIIGHPNDIDDDYGFRCARSY